ncbi:hypothetical protein pp309_000059 [Proteus phage 309]|uniref:Uncharacterized protein n=1 Tax=Proteus phage 309 TaxID=2894355 RepID=A0AAE8YHP5_9CAUD|nr:hypothetical protein pp309_000059 [Proteus phage 309]
MVGHGWFVSCLFLRRASCLFFDGLVIALGVQGKALGYLSDSLVIP